MAAASISMGRSEMRLSPCLALQQANQKGYRSGHHDKLHSPYVQQAGSPLLWV